MFNCHRPLAIVLLHLASPPSAALADDPAVRYAVTFPNRVHHEAEVSVRFSALDPRPLEVRMSRSSPGRYALHEFAKNVYRVRASDADGRPLRVTRPDPHGWSVHGHRGVVEFRYTLFANRCDGSYSAIDTTHAHLNMPATFVWARGLEGRPIEVRFERPEKDWNIATQLFPGAHPDTFRARDLARAAVCVRRSR